jgi:hypothetical protein
VGEHDPNVEVIPYPLLTPLLAVAPDLDVPAGVDPSLHMRHLELQRNSALSESEEAQHDDSSRDIWLDVEAMTFLLRAFCPLTTPSEYATSAAAMQ